MTPPTRTTPRIDPSLGLEIANRRLWQAGVIGALNVIVALLAVRLILTIAVAGAIFLAWLALATNDLARVAVLALYTVTVVIPLVWLAAQKR